MKAILIWLSMATRLTKHLITTRLRQGRLNTSHFAREVEHDLADY